MKNEKRDQQNEVTKECIQCHKSLARNQFSNKQWRTKSKPSCRLCAEYTKLSREKSRICHKCKLTLPRTKYAIYQWSKGDEALCISCSDKFGQKILSSIPRNDIMDVDEETSLKDMMGLGMATKKTKELAGGILVCNEHSMETCDVCMMDFTLPNDFARKRTKLGRDLTPEEYEKVTKDFWASSNVRISKKICIMDGQPVCPRSGRKMVCPCKEVTYCSTACQKHHWMIHKMTCKWHTKKKEEKLRKAKKRENEMKLPKAAAASKSKSVSNDLTEEQKNFARIEAFLAENNGSKHSIEECAWQFGEHPFVIGGGSIRYGPSGEEFVKGDVAQIYKERLGVEWDGTPRFGLGPYVQKKPTVDWIAKARQGKSQQMKNLESELMGRLKI